MNSWTRHFQSPGQQTRSKQRCSDEDQVKKGLRTMLKALPATRVDLIRADSYSTEPSLDPDDSVSVSTASHDMSTPVSRVPSVAQGWYSGMKIRFQVPLDPVPREPTFSGRLGKLPRVQRASSEESIATKLSLLTCSMKNQETKEERRAQRHRRRLRKKATTPVVPAKGGTESKWMYFLNKRRQAGLLDRLMVNQNAQAMVHFNIDQSQLNQVSGAESMYDLLEEDERTMLYRSAFTYGVFLPCGGLKKSGSTENLTKHEPRRPKPVSAGTKRSLKDPRIDFQALKERFGRQTRASGVCSEVGLEIETPLEATGDLPTEKPLAEDKPVSVWHGDELETDLKREFTTKVRERIKSTTRALKLLTGIGERPKRDGGSRNQSSRLSSRISINNFRQPAKILQRVRLSPHLSKVIGEDIKSRIGRPKYREIRIKDIAAWDREQKLDRTHRNLKVFNWLHSLKEDDFEKEIEQVIDDRPPGDDLCRAVGAMHIEACDDPDEKPLFANAAAKFVKRVQQTATSA